MKLSLIFPAWFEEFGSYSHAAKKVSTFPPLNLCIIAALAEREGWDVELIDAHIEQLSHSELVERVAVFEPDLVGLTATTPFFHNAVKVAQLLKERLPAPVMIGGTHATVCQEEAFADCFDYLFTGECDLNLPEFLRKFAGGDRTPVVPGILMRIDGRTVSHGNVPLLQNLDESPLPARHLLRNDLYFMGTAQGRHRYTSLQMSRGCPFSCVFCACDIHGKALRMRGIDSVLAELDLAVKQYGASHIYFIDDTLSINRDYLLKLCDGIEKQGLRFTFEGSTRANLWDEELVQRLKACGLVRISFGFETADESVREIIKKTVPLESYNKANLLNAKYGIETINSVMIGLPGETRESINRTFSYIANSREIQHVTLNIAMPYPGTELMKMAERGEHGLVLLNRDFSRYQRYDSAVMEVNGITPEELIALQKKGLLRIYLKWWRWLPIIRRFGLRTVVNTGITTLAALFARKKI